MSQKDYDATAAALGQKLSEFYQNLEPNEKRVFDSIVNVERNQSVISSPVHVAAGATSIALMSTVAYW